MVPARVEAEELDVEHVREPGERVPVRGVTLENAQRSAAGESPRAGGVAGDVRQVVEEDELVPDRRHEDPEGERGQGDGHEPPAVAPRLPPMAGPTIPRRPGADNATLPPSP